MSELEHAWAAGFFDGEGTAYIQRTRSKIPGRIYKRLRLSLAQVDRRLLERFAKAVGGGRVTGPYSKRHQAGRDYYVWGVTKPDDVAQVLINIEPYLGPAKREQLEVARKEMEEYAQRPRLKTGPKAKKQ